jgi:hypothetical protein
MPAVRVAYKLAAKVEQDFTGFKGPYKFENGFFVSVIDSGKVEKTNRVMGTFYGAFPYKAEQGDGSGQVPAAPAEGGPGAEVPLHGGLRPDGQGPAAQDAALGGADAGAGSGSQGSVPSGDGHQDSGDDGSAERTRRVREAVAALDPENDEHWTAGGVPRIDAVEKALGRAGLTRAEVERAVPGYTRDTARV